MADSNQHKETVTTFISHKANGKIPMKQLKLLFFMISILFLLSGCGIPDLPGPIGIPGL
jgi:hypothetical protein